MKKALKITGIIFGILVLIYLFVPQLAAKIYTEKKYEHSDCTLKEFPYNDVKIPDEWKTIECEGLTLKVPENVNCKDPDNDIRRRMFIDGEKDENTITIMFFEHKAETLDESLGDQSKEDLEKTMKNAGFEPPKSRYDFFNFVYNVTPKDFGIVTLGKSPLRMLSIINGKELMYDATVVNSHTSDSSVCEDFYSFETENAVGFFSLYGTPSEKRNKYIYFVELYDKKNPDISGSVLVNAADQNTAWTMAVSAELK